jgi:tetratricopeptide (TPR) repeat protein
MNDLSRGKGQTEEIPLALDLAELERLIKVKNIDIACGKVRASDRFVPLTESDWSRYHDVLQKLNLRAQDEIMTVKFLEARPDAAMVRLNLAAILVQAKRVKAAQAEIDLALSHPVQTAEFWRKVSWLTGQISNWGQLLITTQAGLTLAPSDFRLRYDYAAALFFLGQRGKSISAFRTALEHTNGDIDRCLGMVKFADRWNITEAAEMAFGTALQLTKMKQKKEDWLKLVSFLMENLNLERTDRLIEFAASAGIKDTETLSSLFAYATGAAQPTFALAIGRQLQVLKPDMPELAGQLAKLEARVERPAHSSETWWQALNPAAKPKN